ncbi:hypothetical protein CONLIGDRAFT_683130 [Coniochaeta ligniaria NRRL 30616]|uniref:Uncharacterized protein n=1 Tax=Coniochaeta ligniaria NRRL 30616 TaxID=1408157 RepID=A0A1J7JEL4_9PEZI|nr:hypothetical protein CONLIGDRAFT_683130 [Coniochaeta ligniaria NRRL 30616]
MASHTSAVRQLCVAPLSSPYSLLPRAHTYVLVTALIVPLPRGWLFRAALAAFTTRTAIFAIDAAVILHSVSGMATAITEPVPMDAVVVLEILGLAVIVACWLLLASSRAGESSARPLIRVWATLVTIGSILAFVSVAKLGTLVAAGDPDTTMAHEDCEGIWMDELDVFGAAENVIVLGLTGWKFAWLEHRVGVPSLLFTAIALLGISAPKKRRATARRVDMEHNPHEISVDEHSALQSQLHPIKKVFEVLLWLVVPAMAILLIVSTEQYLLTMSSHIPSVEKMSSVGQWGVWAATGAVLVATLINAVREKMGLQKEGMKPVGDKSDTVII